MATTSTTTDRPTPAGHGTSNQVPPGQAARRLPPWLLPAGVVSLAMALPVWGMWIAPGPPMEEGFMLVFPERILAGDVPNRDFLHLYGPGSLWMLAGVYNLLGVDLWVERLVGLLQLVALVAGVAFVGYRWGRWTAVAAGLTTTIVIMPPIGLTALAWVGGVALALWAVIVALSALDWSHHGERVSTRRRRLLVGGVLGGLALLFRPDLVLAVGLPFGVMWIWALDRSSRRHLLAGVLAGVSPYLLHLVLAGPANAFRGIVTEPIFDLRPGRRLPFPPPLDDYSSYLNRAFAFGDRSWSWPLPALSETRQIFVWVPLVFLACAALLTVGVLALRAGRRSQGWWLLTLGLLAVGTLPQVIQRPDTAHLAWVSAVPFGLLSAALVEAARLWGRSRRTTTAAAVAALPALLALAMIPNFTWRWYGDYVAKTFGHGRDGHAIVHRGRTFYYGREEIAEAARSLLADAEDVTRPGQTLVVGPGDLRKTNYSEVYLYFLLPQLEPGTEYIEMDPGVANAADSGLAGEIRQADVVILSTVYDGWDEPNASREFGSNAPNQALAAEFCLHDEYGTNPAQDDRGFYELYLRC